MVDPFLEKKGLPMFSWRSEALTKALPRVSSSRTKVQANTETAEQAMIGAHAFRQRLQIADARE